MNASAGQMTATELRPARRGPWAQVRAVVGGAAGAWLVAQMLTVGLALRPGLGPGSLSDLASAVAAIGGLAGLACALLAPVAAVLALAVRRVPGGGVLISGLVGAAGGLMLLYLLAGNGIFPHPVGGVLGAVCGLAGWFASSRAKRSSAWAVTLLVTAAGLWGAAILAA